MHSERVPLCLVASASVQSELSANTARLLRQGGVLASDSAFSRSNVIPQRYSS